MQRVVITIVTALLALSVTPTWAKTSNRDLYKDVAQILTEKMADRLELDQDQIQRVEKINLEYIKLTAEVRSSDLGKGAKIALVRKYHDDKMAELEEILTIVQYNRYVMGVERIKSVVLDRYMYW